MGYGEEGGDVIHENTICFDIQNIIDISKLKCRRFTHI